MRDQRGDGAAAPHRRALCASWWARRSCGSRPGAHVTCSIGAAVVQLDDTIDELLRRADQALYRAKSEGRNRVVA